MQAQIQLEILPPPSIEEVRQWEAIIEAKAAPILATAVSAQVDRFVTLNSKDFTPEVAAQSGMVVEWATFHRDELRKNWDLARQMQTLNRIEPLE